MFKDKKRGTAKSLFSIENSSIFYRTLVCSGKDEAALKKLTIPLHRITTGAAYAVFLISLIRMLFVYDSLPDETGVHFESIGLIFCKYGFTGLFTEHQDYDVTASKLFIIYPYAVSVLALIISIAAEKLSKKLKFGDHADESAVFGVRTALIIALDIIKLTITVYFCAFWTEAQIHGVPMRALVTLLYIIFLVMTIMDLIFFTIIMKNRLPENRKE